MQRLFRVVILLAFALCMVGCAREGCTDCFSPEMTVEDQQKMTPEEQYTSYPEWKCKTVQAVFKGLDRDMVIVYDTEDDTTFEYGSQGMPYSLYVQFLNNVREGSKVNIEVNSLVRPDTGEVLRRESHKIWL